MKKMICMAALLLCSVATLKAQTPQPPKPTTSSFTNADRANSVKGEQAPIAPATLLLLGLAGGFAAVKVYHNTKKKEEQL